MSSSESAVRALAPSADAAPARTVLVVDDSAFMRRLVAERLNILQGQRRQLESIGIDRRARPPLGKNPPGTIDFGIQRSHGGYA